MEDVKKAGRYLDEPGVDLVEVASHLHGDESQMVLLIHPDEEGLVVVEVDATAGGPVVVATSCPQEPATDKIKINVR